MRKPAYFFLILMLSLAFPVWASDTRVDSTGGLALLLNDEAVAVQPFVLGNPAGLALLPRVHRFDLSGSFFDQQVPLASRDSQFYGSTEIGVDAVKYHGLTLFPADHLALQLDGDIRRIDDLVQVFLYSNGMDQTRELLRLAYDFGPFVLGAEAQPSQTRLSFELQPSSLTSGGAFGAGSVDQWQVRGGLLARFPPDPTAKEARLTLGGTYSLQPIPSETRLDLSIVSAGPVTQAVTAAVSGTSSQSFGPEIYYEVPGSLQGGLVVRFTDSSTSFSTDSASATLVVPAFPYQDSTQTSGALVLKAASPLSKVQSLKWGLFASYEDSKSSTFTPSSALDHRQTMTKLRVKTGLGVEKKDDFLMGLQLELEKADGDFETPVTLTKGATDFLGYKVVLGGEKWIAKGWAFRTGLSFENDLEGGTQDYKLPLFTISDGQRIVTTTISVGTGFREEAFQADFLLFYGQPSLYDSPSPQGFANQFGIQTAVGFFFK